MRDNTAPHGPACGSNQPSGRFMACEAIRHPCQRAERAWRDHGARNPPHRINVIGFHRRNLPLDLPTATRTA
jgi:hypothetical protein